MTTLTSTSMENRTVSPATLPDITIPDRTSSLLALKKADEHLVPSHQGTVNGNVNGVGKIPALNPSSSSSTRSERTKSPSPTPSPGLPPLRQQTPERSTATEVDLPSTPLPQIQTAVPTTPATVATSSVYKRTSSGTLKPTQHSSSVPNSPTVPRVKDKTPTINPERIAELSSDLRTRLSYALLKVQNGWQKRSLDEVESICSQQGSPVSAGRKARDSMSASPRRFSMSGTPGSGYNGVGPAVGGYRSDERFAESVRHHQRLAPGPAIHQPPRLQHSYTVPASMHSSFPPQELQHHVQPQLHPQINTLPQLPQVERTYDSFWKAHPPTSLLRSTSSLSSLSHHSTLAPAPTLHQARRFTNPSHSPALLRREPSSASTLSVYSSSSTAVSLVPDSENGERDGERERERRPGHGHEGDAGLANGRLEREAVESLMELSSPMGGRRRASNAGGEERERKIARVERVERVGG